ncbi:MAG: hypothetical protein ACAF41_00290 (plasmid) [Leptolyngbya sp. BL-A-14]
MMNHSETQSLQIISQSPSLQPNIEPPQFPLDSTNPLVWLLLLTALLRNTDEVINAVTKLIQAIGALTCRHGKEEDRDS